MNDKLKSLGENEIKLVCKEMGISRQDLFEMDDDGKAVAKTNPVPGGNEDDARDAESSCPVNAISLD